jgi:hypothetical protein
MIFPGLNEVSGQWSVNGSHIFNSNIGNVGVGSDSPTTLLHVQQLMTEPTITVQNLGGGGGATYVMSDNASGANWKFKATSNGGFKIRDHANLMDVVIIEPNSLANALYITSSNNIGLGTSSPGSSTIMDLTSLTDGFLPPRMTQAEIIGIVGPADGLMVFCTTDEKFYIYQSNINVWKEILYGPGTIVPNIP